MAAALELVQESAASSGISTTFVFPMAVSSSATESSYAPYQPLRERPPPMLPTQPLLSRTLQYPVAHHAFSNGGPQRRH
ncbi:hypothetical protein Pcinc_011040 [Petrolisthes cinctipes]|uniref:Uncharacterized protein n=1 Tax=Petrolisthes cinctipes TaxID=88211 RepID=A0AAE1KUV1_PETCI|nr:hypothetical protein Pcinc_011040 [Petrolisthes cinctipes]